MDLKEAFYKQKEELHTSQQTVLRLQKQIDRFYRETAKEELFQEQLSHIRGLNNKVSEWKRIADRYRSLYEREVATGKKLSDLLMEEELKNSDLQRRLESLAMEYADPAVLQDALAKIEALENEVARLTALLERDGTNTGTPTSRTDIDKTKVIPNSRNKTDRHIGGQKGHEKNTLPAFQEDEITDSAVHGLDSCPYCGGPLEEIRDISKDETDYEVRVVKKRHTFKEYRCTQCGRTVRSSDPALKAENQYGPMIQAMALALTNIGTVSVNRTEKLLSGLVSEGPSPSEGYLCKLQKRYSSRLRSFVQEVRSACISSGLLYWDDTVVFINTSRGCFRFYGNEKVALYRAHSGKGLDGIFEDNVLPVLRPSTVVMHDHNSINYHEGFVFTNVECLQHLERDFQKVSDQSGHQWSDGMKKLFQSMIHKRKLLLEQGADHFDTTDTASFFKEYDRFLESGSAEAKADRNHYYSQFELSLLVRLKEYRKNYTAWLFDFSIPTTNNLSERALRFIKSKSKISGQFQNVQYARFFADIRTYIETCARNGINEFQAILRLTCGKPYSLSELLSPGGV